MEDQKQPIIIEHQVSHPVITVGEWFITILITAIPLVGLIMLFVWAFSTGTNPAKGNWAKAMLIWAAIVVVLYIILFATLGMALFRGFSS
jgi:hypothetical protein